MGRWNSGRLRKSGQLRGLEGQADVVLLSLSSDHLQSFPPQTSQWALAVS